MTSFDTPHCVHGNDARACRQCYEMKPAAALGLAEGDKPYPELFKHWITTVYASGMPDVPDEFTRADMAKAFDAGAARYNDLLQSWSECRGELQKERNLVDTLRSALKDEAQRSEAYLAAYHSATDDLRVAHKLLNEGRSREYHDALEREVTTNARGLQCGWPACLSNFKVGLTGEMIEAEAESTTKEGFGWPLATFKQGFIWGARWARQALVDTITVSREGEAGSRSATKPDANLAGPEGDARPAPHRHDAGCFDCCPGPEWPQ